MFERSIATMIREAATEFDRARLEADVIRLRAISEEWKALYLREKGALEAALAQMAKG